MKSQMTWLCLMNITEAKIPLTTTEVVARTGLGSDYTSLD